MQCAYSRIVVVLPVHADWLDGVPVSDLQLMSGRRRMDGWNFNMKGNAHIATLSNLHHMNFISDPICIACAPHGTDSYSIVTNAVATRLVAMCVRLNADSCTRVALSGV